MKFSRSVDAVVLGTNEWIRLVSCPASAFISFVRSPFVEMSSGEDADKVKFETVVEKSAALVSMCARHTDSDEPIWTTPEEVQADLDWPQIDNLARRCLALCGINAEARSVAEHFRDGAREAPGVDPAQHGTNLREAAIGANGA